MTEQTNTPALRFPGFSENWEIIKVRDLSQKTIGGGTPNTSKSNYWKGELNWIQSSDLSLDNLFKHRSKKYINDKALNNSSAKKIPANSIAIVSRVGVGKLVYINHEYATSQDFINLVHLNYPFKFIMYSLYLLLKGEANKLQGTSIKGLTKKDLLNYPLNIPKTIEEQEKIGVFFNKLDRQIELEEEKLELLEQQKHGYMQKIFSQELRFKDKKDDYYSDWKNYQLKDLTYYKNGKGYEKVATTNGKYNIINLNSIGVKGQLKDSGKYTNFEDDTLLKNDLIMILSDVAKGNLIGMTAIIDENNKYLLNQRIALLRIKNSLITNAYFLYLYINFNRKYFINMSTGMSQLNINKKTVEDFQVNLPNIEEQNKIAILFKNYEDNIKKQASKVKLLKQRKKGLLQKMFV